MLTPSTNETEWVFSVMGVPIEAGEVLFPSLELSQRRPRNTMLMTIDLVSFPKGTKEIAVKLRKIKTMADLDFLNMDVVDALEYRS